MLKKPTVNTDFVPQEEPLTGVWRRQLMAYLSDAYSGVSIQDDDWVTPTRPVDQDVAEKLQAKAREYLDEVVTVKQGAWGVRVAKTANPKALILEGHTMDVTLAKARSKVMRSFPSWPECCGVQTKLIRADEPFSNTGVGAKKRYMLVCKTCSDDVWKEFIDSMKDVQ